MEVFECIAAPKGAIQICYSCERICPLSAEPGLMGQFTDAEKEAMKEEAGIEACTFVKSGMKIGIGTGSTVKYTILELGRRIREEGLEIAGIPTSDATEKLSIEQGIPMMDWRLLSSQPRVICVTH